MSVLDIFQDVTFQEEVIKYQYHTYQPRTTNYSRSDEVRIVIQQEDMLTLPSESYLEIGGDVVIPAGAANVPAFTLTQNAFSFLFEEIRYELNGTEVDKNRNVGITSTMKGLLSLRAEDKNSVEIAGWSATGELKTYFPATRKFYAIIPLKYLLGFAEDYRRVIAHVKQELILLRSSTDQNCYMGPVGAIFNLTKIEWHVPIIKTSLKNQVAMNAHIKQDESSLIPYRRWELHELPALRQTDKDIWSVKTSSSLEKPRYVIVAFQTNRRNNVALDCSRFDHCGIKDIKIELNSETYPYDALNLDIAGGNYTRAYYMYSAFQNSYHHDRPAGTPMMDYSQMFHQMLYVFDVSKQDDSMKSGTVDLKIVLEASAAFNPATRGYCLILCDSIVEYRPLSGYVRKLI